MSIVFFIIVNAITLDPFVFQLNLLNHHTNELNMLKLVFHSNANNKAIK